jgi:hypothetical protein
MYVKITPSSRRWTILTIVVSFSSHALRQPVCGTEAVQAPQVNTTDPSEPCKANQIDIERLAVMREANSMRYVALSCRNDQPENSPLGVRTGQLCRSLRLAWPRPDSSRRRPSARMHYLYSNESDSIKFEFA